MKQAKANDHKFERGKLVELAHVVFLLLVEVVLSFKTSSSFKSNLSVIFNI